MLDDLHVRVEVAQPPRRRLHLVDADVADAEQHLALEVAGADDVDVREPDRAHAGSGQIQADRAAEPAGADAQHLRVQQLLLTLHPHLGQDQVALVAVDLVAAELRDGGLGLRRGGEGLCHVRTDGVPRPKRKNHARNGMARGRTSAAL